MKVLLLAGGYATRLMPLSQDMPKPLLTVKGKASIDYILDALEGIPREATFILTNKKFSNRFEEWKNEKGMSLSLIVEDGTSEKEKPGAIVAIADAIRQLGDDDYMIIAGDNVFTMKLNGMYEYFLTKHAPVIGIYDVRDPHLARMYSTVDVDKKGRLIAMQEKPKAPKGTLIATCIYIFPNGLLSILERYLLSSGNKDSPGYFIEWLSEETDVYTYRITGKWFDVGSVQTYERAKREI